MMSNKTITDENEALRRMLREHMEQIASPSKELAVWWDNEQAVIDRERKEDEERRANRRAVLEQEIKERTEELAGL